MSHPNPQFLNVLIAAALAPAVLVSASALLLLGLQNKYTAISGRVRDLQRERRALDGGPECAGRIRSIGVQTEHLLTRLRQMRLAIGALYLALCSFLFVSLATTVGGLAGWNYAGVALTLFVSGIAAMVVAAVCELLEVRLAYHAVVEDTRS